IEYLNSESLFQLYYRDFRRTVSNEPFQLQTKSLIKQFQSSTTNTLLRILDFIRKTTQANGLLSDVSTILDSTIQSQYLRNTTIQELVNNLMIEQSLITTSYSSYYDEC
ncbi:unnamed protein product, partial [Didymodactylos carnosus]